MLIDPHDRNPHALLWVACDETNNYWAYREAWLADTLIEDVVAYIKKVELDARERVQLRIMDPNFGPKRYINKGLTVRDEFEDASRKLNYPIRFSFGDDRKEIGRKSFATMLKFDTSFIFIIVVLIRFGLRSISSLAQSVIRRNSPDKETYSSF